jgi:hypothetical protein
MKTNSTRAGTMPRPGAPCWSGKPFLLLVATAATVLLAGPARGAGPADALSPGVVEFAGRVARHYWHLFGPEKRADLEALNRELRAAQLDSQTARDPAARQAATNRLTDVVTRVLEQVKRCPRLIRVDLTARPPVCAPGGPFELPGDTGALLVEVSAGGAGVSYTTSTFDWSATEGDQSSVPLEVAARGATYAVVGLEHVPQNRTTLGLEFRRPERPPALVLLEVVAPPPGRLKFAALSDDTGTPVPAMMLLRWRTDGQPRPPVNAVDLGPQFDRQGRSGQSGERHPNLPGAGDAFWCAPGPFDMALSPGIWEVVVRRGAEHEVVATNVTVRAGEMATLTVRPQRWVNMSRRGWWSGDDHVHCRILSDQDARHLMAWVQAEDIHLANVVEMGDIYRTYFQQRGFGPDHRVVAGNSVLSPGQECPRTHAQLGHTLAMNTTNLVRDTDRYFLYDEVFDAVHAQGGLSGYAHVGTGNFHVHRDMSLNVPRGKVDFAEILQFNRLGTELYYDFLNLGCKLTASAGSDVPWGGTVGEVRVYAFLGRKPFTADAWFEAFRRGRTFTTSGPMIEFRVDRALPGDEIRLAADRKLRVRARAWGDPKRMAPVKLEIVRHGEVIRSAESTDPNRPEAGLDFTVDAGYGCWLAARARAGDGTSAHTTPVYVVRDGLRFWKFDGLEELLAQRQASLAEIEEMIREAQRLEARGANEKNLYRKQLARQGDLLRQRVAAARALYAELQREAGAERARRGLPAP